MRSELTVIQRDLLAALVERVNKAGIVLWQDGKELMFNPRGKMLAAKNAQLFASICRWKEELKRYLHESVD